MSHLLTSLMTRQLLPLIGYMFVVFNSFLCFSYFDIILLKQYCEAQLNTFI